MSAGLTIGGLARSAGVNIETVRYYQRRGLILEPPRPLRGYRRYDADVVGRILFIKRAQQLGFTLNEIAELLELGDGCCANVRQVAEDKRARVQAQISDLQAIRGALDELIEACQESESTPHCALIEALAQDSA